jgi:arsenite/tail-anchored protein-transporting ATPase
VGKTTCAAAMAVAWARRGFRTLVISTDPAPSLGDAFEQPLGAAPRAVRGVKGLHAVEVDASRALALWIKTRRSTLEEIALRGTWLDADDVARLLRLSLPGIDEIAGLLQFRDLASAGAYERIVVDTAPTGHLLRMLEMPRLLAGLARIFDHMQGKHRTLVEALRGSWTPDGADRLIHDLDRQATDTRDLLRDASRTSLSWVTLPERMSIAESADGIRWLRAFGISIDAVILNRVTPPPPGPCRWCDLRRDEEDAVAQGIARVRDLRGIPVRSIPAVQREPRGVAALEAIAGHLERRPARGSGRAPRAKRTAVAELPRTPAPVESDTIAPAASRLVWFGGKGGVGKTTCAAAAAIGIARKSPSRQVLLVSTDPAHSLGDVFDRRFSDTPRRVRGAPPNLRVRELDAARIFADLQAQFRHATEQLFEHLSAGAIDIAHDRRVMLDLIDLAPPGIDELVAVIDVIDLLFAAESPAHDVIVIDTAPTGHGLRLIEMPALAHEWVKAVMRILLKYQPLVRVGELGAVLLKLSRGLGRLRELMRDPMRARFVAITRAAALPRAETLRLLARLKTAHVSAPLVIVNAVGAGTCRRCRAERADQQREIAELLRIMRRSRRAVLVAPAVLPPPHGAAALERWRETWTRF